MQVLKVYSWPGLEFVRPAIWLRTRSQKPWKQNSCRIINTGWLDHLVTPVQFLQLNSPIREGGGASDSGVRLAVVIGGFHLEDVGDDAVDLHVTNEPCEEQLLSDGGAYQPEGRQTHQQLGEPEKRGHGTQTCAVEHSFLMCWHRLSTDR